MMPPATRFSGVSRQTALAMLAALAALIGLGLPMATRLTPLSPNPSSPDIRYYRSLVSAVRAGQPYTSAAINLLRARHAATTPFFVVRPPLLAEVLARLPGTASRLADLMLAGVAGVTVGVWLWRLSQLRSDGPFLIRASLILLASVVVSMRGHELAYFHEAWAGLLIAASLAVRMDRRFGLAVALGLVAALLRELTLPYLALMAAFAGLERRWAEAGAFASALALAVSALAVHALRVEAITADDLRAAGGWVAFGGWAFLLETSRWSYLAIPGLGIALLPLAFAGALGWKDGTGSRLAAVLISYALVFLVIGRPDNSYWGLMVMPLAGVGVALAPEALVDLFRRGFARPVVA